jgi:Bacterial type II/III secretion system short domain
MRVRWWMTIVVVGVLAAGVYWPAAAGDDTARAKSALSTRWEYQVLTKEQVADLGKKNLAAGLNKLGDESWELVAVEAGSPPETQVGKPSGAVTFYFKRQAVRTESQPPGGGEFMSYSLKTANAVQAAKVIQEMFGADRKRLRVVADERTNQILVQASATDLPLIEKIVQLLDTPGSK